MKKNKLIKLALGLYGRCILSSFLGLFMYTSISIIVFSLMPKEQDKISATANLVSCIVTLLLQGFLYITIVWSNLWQHGDRDGTKDMFQKQKGNPHYGLWVGLIATIPSWIAYILLIVEKAATLWNPYIVLYRVFNGALYPIIEWTLHKAWDTKIVDVSWTGVLLSALPIVITVVTAWVAYWIGYKQIPIMKKLMYKNPAARK